MKCTVIIYTKYDRTTPVNTIPCESKTEASKLRSEMRKTIDLDRYKIIIK